MSTATIVLASNNAGKLRELTHLLAPLALTVQPMRDFGIDSPPEDGLTFVENALIKARYSAQQSGLPAIADDSGLAVAALDGAPGIYSSRYAGVDGDDSANNTKLLAALAGQRDRAAAFHCCLVFLRHAADPTPIISTASWPGKIAHAAKGDYGFGYDPLFIDDTTGLHSAELTAEQKGAVSHRGKAMRQFIALMSEAGIVALPSSSDG